MSIASSANEATTRSQVIDTQLAQAGWSKSRRSLVEEFVVVAKEPDRSYDGQQFADYVLLGSDFRAIEFHSPLMPFSRISLPKSA